MPSKCKISPALHCPVRDCSCSSCKNKRKTSHRTRDALRSLRGGGARGAIPMKKIPTNIIKQRGNQIRFPSKSSTGTPKRGIRNEYTILPKSTLKVPRHGTYRCRLNTNDKAVIMELTSYKTLFDNIDANGPQKLLDLGGHIGCISIEAALRRCNVVALEPFPSNIAAFKIHMELNNVTKKIKLLEGAVVGPQCSDTTVPLAINAGINMGTHSVLDIRGRHKIQVDAFNVTRILSKYKPYYVKIDIEGTEYDVLPSIWECRSVQTIFAELHYGHANLRPKLNKILRSKPSFWKTVRKPQITPKGRATIVMWTRKPS